MFCIAPEFANAIHFERLRKQQLPAAVAKKIFASQHDKKSSPTLRMVH